MKYFFKMEALEKMIVDYEVKKMLEVLENKNLLTEKEKNTIIELYLEGKTVAELCREKGVSRATLIETKIRALYKLKSKLKYIVVE